MAKQHYQWKIGSRLPKLGEHSLAKHEIFERYIAIYINHLTRIPGQTQLNLTLIDGFCGGGSYDHKGGVINGSPLRILTAVEDRQTALNDTRRTPPKINADYFFIDENKNHVAFLDDLLRQRGYGCRIDDDIFLRCSSFEDSLPQIIAHIQRKGRAHRSLFFLDQYGWSDVRLATIRTILQSLENPEILLTFAVDALINFLSEKNSDFEALVAIDFRREDVRDLISMRNEDGWRFLIQNGLYKHIQAKTGANFYTPFFIHSPESHRSYWLIHLSNHRQARDEMGKLHWALQNHFRHHGGAGFHALGFDPSRDLRQNLMSFMFDDDARAQSEKAVLAELPKLMRDSGQTATSVESLFTARCNDTPVTSDILKSQILVLRDAGEVQILGPDGSPKPRATNISWGDRVLLPAQRNLFGPFGVKE
jgi:three-Cys-motif partner protein